MPKRARRAPSSWSWFRAAGCPAPASASAPRRLALGDLHARPGRVMVEGVRPRGLRIRDRARLLGGVAAFSTRKESPVRRVADGKRPGGPHAEHSQNVGRRGHPSPRRTGWRVSRARRRILRWNRSRLGAHVGVRHLASRSGRERGRVAASLHRATAVARLGAPPATNLLPQLAAEVIAGTADLPLPLRHHSGTLAQVTVFGLEACASSIASRRLAL